MTDGSEELCSGKDCKKRPTNLLKIRYIRKVGRFCEECAADLLNAGLVEDADVRKNPINVQ